MYILLYTIKNYKTLYCTFDGHRCEVKIVAVPVVDADDVLATIVGRDRVDCQTGHAELVGYTYVRVGLQHFALYTKYDCLYYCCNNSKLDTPLDYNIVIIRNIICD